MHLPTPDELALWLRVAGPPTVTGALRWTPGEQDLSFGWVVFGQPVFADLPPGVEVAVVHEAPDRWALAGPEGPLARADGRRAAVWRHGEVEVAQSLVVAPSPLLLLRPEPPEVPGGQVVADELLGRPCWRWTDGDTTRWVDDATACLLRTTAPSGTLELTAFAPGAAVDAGAFDLDAVAGPAGPSAAAEVRAEREGRAAAGFAVPWWPHGTQSWPVAGDPDAGSLLVQLATTDEAAPTVWVGVAPAGTPAPVRPGVRSQRWDGDGCSLSLSWTRGLSDDDRARLVAETPGAWP